VRTFASQLRTFGKTWGFSLAQPNSRAFRRLRIFAGKLRIFEKTRGFSLAWPNS
jgi:hypothetical protein